MSWLFLLSTRIRAFGAQCRATAAVEFAIVLPAALLLYLGAYEISNAIVTSRHLSEVTRTSVDLLSQQATSGSDTSFPPPGAAMSGSDVTSLLKGVQMLMAPKALGPLSVTLTAVDVKNNASGVCCSATVRWSVTQGGTLRPCNAQLTRGVNGTIDPNTLPTDLLPTDGSTLSQPIAYLIADTSYAYQPLMGGTFVPVVHTMQRTEYMRPRTTGQVVLASVPNVQGQSGRICY